MIGQAEFGVMKEGVYIVNTARGPIIHEPSLIDALKVGKVARAGLDVFSNEPNLDPFFQKSDKVIIQPHLGGLTDMAYHKAEKEAFENVRAFFRTGKPNSPVVEPKTK